MKRAQKKTDIFNFLRKTILSIVVILCSSEIWAATYRWVGKGTDNNWSTKENWQYSSGNNNWTNAAQAPGTSDIVIIKTSTEDNNPAVRNIEITLDSDITVAGLLSFGLGTFKITSSGKTFNATTVFVGSSSHSYRTSEAPAKLTGLGNINYIQENWQGNLTISGSTTVNITNIDTSSWTKNNAQNTITLTDTSKLIVTEKWNSGNNNQGGSHGTDRTNISKDTTAVIGVTGEIIGSEGCDSDLSESLDAGGAAVVDTPVATGDSSYIWLGTDNDWNTASNWYPARIPNSTDSVVLISKTSNNPVLNSNVDVKSVAIAKDSNVTLDATLNINGDYNLNFATDIVSTSTGTLKSTGTITVNATYTSSSLTLECENLVVNGNLNCTNLSASTGTTINSGKTLTFNASNSLGKITNNGTIDFGANDYSLTTYSGTGEIKINGATLTNSTGSEVTIGKLTPGTTESTLAGGTAGFAVSSIEGTNGNLKTTGNISLAGQLDTLNVDSGEVSISGATTVNSLTNGGKINIGSNSLTVKSYTGTGNGISINGGTLTNNSSSKITIDTLSPGTTESTLAGGTEGLKISVLNGTTGKLKTSGTVSLEGQLDSLTVSSGNLIFTDSSQIGSLTNNGTINIGAYTLTNTSSCSGTGKIITDGGTIDYSGSAATINTLEISSSATLKGGTNGITVTNATYTSAPALTTYGKISIPGGTVGDLTISGGTTTVQRRTDLSASNVLIDSSSKLIANGKLTASSITINSSGNLTTAAGKIISLSGNWTNNAGTSGYTYTTSGTISFTDTATITGATNFYNFSAENLSSKTLTINGDVTVNGTLKLSGATYSNPLTIDGTGTLSLATSQDGGKFLVVTDVHRISTSTKTYTATASRSTNATVPAGWIFSNKYLWNGTGTNWNNASSWNINTDGNNYSQSSTYPQVTDDEVIIDNTTTNTAILPSNLSLKTVTVNAGATLDLSSYNLKVPAITNNGTIKLLGTQTIATSAGSAVSLTNGTNSTIEYYGSQTVSSFFTTSFAKLKIDSGSTLQLGTTSLSAVDVDNSGEIQINGTGSLTISSSLSNTGTVSLSSTGTISKTDAAKGLFKYTGASTLINFGTDDYYNLQISSSCSSPTDEIKVAKKLTVDSGKTITLGGNLLALTIENNGKIVCGTKNLEFTNYSGTSDEITASTGTITSGSAATISALTLQGGTLLNNSSGLITVTALTLSDTESTLNAGSGSITVTNALSTGKLLTSGTVNLKGQLTGLKVSSGTTTAGGELTITGTSPYLTVIGTLAMGANNLKLTGTSTNKVSVTGSGSITISNSQINGNYINITADSGPTVTGGTYTATNSTTATTSPTNGWNILAGDLVYVWNGSSSDSLTIAANWNTAIAPPASTDDIEIAVVASGNNYPLLSADATFNNVTVDASATLDFASFNLTATSFTNNGKIRLSGTNTITASSTYGGSNTIEYYGTSTSAVTGSGAPSATDYKNLTIASGATLSLGTQSITVGRTLSNEGTIDINGTGIFTIAATGTADSDSGLIEYSLKTATTTTIPNIGFYNLKISNGDWTDTSSAGLSTKNDFEITGGSLTCAGALTVTNSLTVNTPSDVKLNNGTGGQTSTAASATFTSGTIYLGNDSADSFSITGSGKKLELSGSATFHTAGTLSGAAGITLGKAITADAATTFSDAVTLSGGSAITNSTNAIAFSSTVDGGYALSTTGTGTVTFGNKVGGTTNLASINITGATNLNTTDVKTTGTQTFGEITLGSNAELTAGGTITLNGTVYGTTYNLTLTGDTTCSTGTIGVKKLTNSTGKTFTASSPLSLTGDFDNKGTFSSTAAANTLSVTGAVTNSGTISSAAPITISGSMTNTGTVNSSSIISLTGNLTDTSGTWTAGSIIFNGTDNQSFSPNTATQYSSVAFENTGSGKTVTIADTIKITSVTNSGGKNSNITFSKGSTITNAVVFNTTGTVTLGSNSETNTFTGGITHTTGTTTINGSVTTTDSLINLGTLNSADGKSIELSSGSGDITFGGTVTTTSLSATSTGSIKVNTTSVTTNGTQTFDGAVTVGNQATTFQGTTVHFKNTLSGQNVLSITGKADFDNTVSGFTTLSVSDISNIAGNVTTTENQTYTKAVTLDGSDITFTSSSGKIINFKETLTGNSQDVTISGASCQIDGNVTLVKNVTTSNIILNGTTTGIGTGNLTITGTADIKKAITGFVDLSINNTALIAANITTTGNQTYNGSTTLNGTLTTSGATSTITFASTAPVTLGANSECNAYNTIFNSTINGGNTLTITGNTEFIGIIGNTTPLTAITVTGLAVINTDKISTTGNQTYNSDVTTSGNIVITAANTTVKANLSVSGNASINGNLLTTGGTTLSPALISIGGSNGLEVTGTYTNNGVISLNNKLTVSEDLINAIDSSLLDVTDTTTVTGSITNLGTATFQNKIYIAKNFTDSGTWTDTSSPIGSIILTGGDNQKFTANPNHTYNSITVNSQKNLNFAENTNIKELEITNAANTVFEKSVTINSYADTATAGNLTFTDNCKISNNTEFLTTGTVIFGSSQNSTVTFTSDDNTTNYNVNHTNGQTELFGTLSAADISFGKTNCNTDIVINCDNLTLTGNLTNEPTVAYAKLYGNLTLSGPIKVSPDFILDGSLTGNTNSSFLKNLYLYTNSSTPADISVTDAIITEDLIVAAPRNINISNTISAYNVVVYKGFINAAANSLIKADKDIVLLGSEYSIQDTINNDPAGFIYQQTRLSPWNYSRADFTQSATMPDGTELPKATVEKGQTPPLSDFNTIYKAQGGASIYAGKNFYANGVTLSGSDEWFVLIPDVTNGNNGFAETYYSQIDHSTVYCHNNTVTLEDDIKDGSKARMPAFRCGDNDNNKWWIFEDFAITEAYTVRDNVVFVEFNHPILNINNELTLSLNRFTNSDGENSYIGFYLDPDCTKPVTTENILSQCVYIKAANSWNTDATGSSAGLENSTDRNGTHKESIPYIEIANQTGASAIKIADIWGKKITKYSGEQKYTEVTDKTGPVLYSVKTGQDLHTIPDGTAESQHSYDSHNFIEFRYSEPTNFGSQDTEISTLWIPAFTDDNEINVTENIKVSDSLGAVQGDITKTASINLAGLGTLENGKIYTGAQGSSNKYVNALYRKDSYSICLSIAGYTEGTVTDTTGNVYKKWVGYIEEAVLPTGSVTMNFVTNESKLNPVVSDINGNFQEYYTDTTQNIIPVINSTTDGIYGLWDISEPIFAPLRMSTTKTKDGQKVNNWTADLLNGKYQSEAIGNTSGVGSTLDRIEFHLFDNTPTFESNEPEWVSEIGWIKPGTEEKKSNLYKDFSYSADIFGGSRTFDDENRTSGGIRYSTVCMEAGAFKFINSMYDDPSLNFAENQATYAGATGLIFIGTSSPRRSALDLDGLYFGLPLPDSSYDIKTTFTVSYDSTNSFITDLAGNRLRSKTFQTIDRTPPSFDVSLSPLNQKELYVTFVKQLVTDSSELIYIDNDGNVKDISNSGKYENLISSCFKLISIDENGVPSDSTGIQIDTSKPAEIMDKSSERFTCIKLYLTQNVTLKDVENLYLAVTNHPDYNEYSQDPFTSHKDSRVTFIQDSNKNYMEMYTAHALSDFAIGAINPLYAYDEDMSAEDDQLMNGLYQEGSWAVHDWTAEQQNYGTLPANHAIGIVTDLDDGTSEKKDLPVKARIYLSNNPDSNSISKQYNSDFNEALRIWLPDTNNKVFAAMSEKNNTNYSYVDSQYMDEKNPAKGFLFDIPQTITKQWASQDQVTFLFGLMDANNKPINIIRSPELNMDVKEVRYLTTSTKYPLFALRLANPADITSIDLWSFKLKSITEQRGGVSILNNVINNSIGEKTVVKVNLPEDGKLSVIVMTLDGNVVTYLQRGQTSSGEHYYAWDGKNKNGTPVARGLYFVRVIANGIDETRKVMVVK